MELKFNCSSFVSSQNIKDLTSIKRFPKRSWPGKSWSLSYSKDSLTLTPTAKRFVVVMVMDFGVRTRTFHARRVVLFVRYNVQLSSWSCIWFLFNILGASSWLCVGIFSRQCVRVMIGECRLLYAVFFCMELLRVRWGARKWKWPVDYSMEVVRLTTASSFNAIQGIFLTFSSQNS